MIRHTGGSELPDISTRSSPSSSAFICASLDGITPSCSPSEPITLTCSCRISSLSLSLASRLLTTCRLLLLIPYLLCKANLVVIIESNKSWDLIASLSRHAFVVDLFSKFLYRHGRQIFTASLTDGDILCFCFPVSYNQHVRYFSQLCCTDFKI